MKLPFRVVVVHQDHGDGDAKHHDAADNDLLAVVVIAFDVLGVFFVEFLESRALVQLCRIHAIHFSDFLVGHVQRVHVGAVIPVKFVGREGRESKEQGENKARGTRCARHSRPET